MPRPERISFELLETFVTVLEHDGDATRAAELLDINQPSISKRLAALRLLTGQRTGEPWLVRKGKRWRVTAEGERVRPVIAELIARYRQMERFVATGAQPHGGVAIACGQQAAAGMVRDAVLRFRHEAPDCRVRVATPRGRARIEGVAGGQFDMACVTDSPATIRRVARAELHIRPLLEDRFVLAAAPIGSSGWSKRWQQLPEQKAATAADLLELPFILPEPDSARRQQFDEWTYRATGRQLSVALEVGGWQTILDYVLHGVGVGLVPASAVEAFDQRRGRKLTVRPLSPTHFPPDAVRLIARKAHGEDKPNLSAEALEFYDTLVATVKGK